MDHDWVRLGKAFKAARAAHEPKLTQEAVMRALDVSRATVQNIERGKEFVRVTGTHRAYAQLLGWTPDSVQQVLAGGEPSRAVESPAETPDSPVEAGASIPEGLPLRVAEELATGPLIDTMVIRLPGGGQAVVVARGKEGGSPEEIQAALEAWRRAQPHLQEIEVLEQPPESSP